MCCACRSVPWPLSSATWLSRAHRSSTRSRYAFRKGQDSSSRVTCQKTELWNAQVDERKAKPVCCVCAGPPSSCPQVQPGYQACPEALPQADSLPSCWKQDSVCLLCVQVCPIAVPRCYLAVKGAQKQYHKLMRFQESQDPTSGQVTCETAQL